MRMPAFLLLPPLLLAFCGPAGADVAPIERAPFHLPVFHNDAVGMIDVVLPAGRETSWHRHSRDFLFVVVRDSELVLQNWGESPKPPVHWPRGFAGYGAFSAASLVHRGENIGAQAMRLVGFELLEPAPRGRTLSARPPAYEQIIDNERLRGWRLELKPGESVPAFEQIAPAVRIIVEAGELVETRDGADHELALQPAAFQWREAGAAPVLRNVGDTTIRLEEFELK
jgi:hypothetical protein